MKSIIYFLFLSLLLAICCLDDSSLMIRKREYHTNTSTKPDFESLRIFMDSRDKYSQHSINSIDFLVHDDVATTAHNSTLLDDNAVNRVRYHSNSDISLLDHCYFWWKINSKNKLWGWFVANPVVEIYSHKDFQKSLEGLIKMMIRYTNLQTNILSVKKLRFFVELGKSRFEVDDPNDQRSSTSEEHLKIAELSERKTVDSIDPCLYEEALNDLLNRLTIAEKSNAPAELMFIQRQLALWYMQIEDYNTASKYLDDALELAKNKLYLLSEEYEMLMIKLELNQLMNNQSEELTILKRLNKLRDSIDYTDTEQKNINAITLKYQKGLYNERFRLNQTIMEKEFFLNRLFRAIFVLIILIMIIIIIGYRMKLKSKTIHLKRQILLLEYEKLNLERSISDRYHNPYNPKQSEQNVQQAAVRFPEQKRDEILEPVQTFCGSKLNDLLKSHLMTDENWNGFKQAFIEEFPLFYDNLKTHYPELTEYNLRMIFLTKLQLTNHEIANILGVSYDAVKKAKQRLRKKVEEPSVEDFIKVLT